MQVNELLLVVIEDLFDGKDKTLSEWVSGNLKWKVENGYMEIVKKGGGIRTKKSKCLASQNGEADCRKHFHIPTGSKLKW